MHLKILITGGAGFIGSHFADSALSRGHTVVVIDNFETGKRDFLGKFQIVKSYSPELKNQVLNLNILNLDNLLLTFKSYRPDLTVHFAANADVRRGLEHPRKDLDYNTVGTWNVAEAVRQSGCNRILFSSTGSIYGEPSQFPTPENCPIPVQTSLYGASKMAAEGFLAAYFHGFGISSLVYRFVSILGPRYTHGHVYDFTRSLMKDPLSLHILGDGKQLKSYLHIDDLIEALWIGIDKIQSGFEILNVGHDQVLSVNESVDVICKTLSVNPKRFFSGGSRGWIGDNPRIQLDCTKLKLMGWSPKWDLKSAVKDTTRFLLQNPDL